MLSSARIVARTIRTQRLVPLQAMATTVANCTAAVPRHTSTHTTAGWTMNRTDHFMKRSMSTTTSSSSSSSSSASSSSSSSTTTSSALQFFPHNVAWDHADFQTTATLAVPFQHPSTPLTLGWFVVPMETTDCSITTDPTDNDDASMAASTHATTTCPTITVSTTEDTTLPIQLMNRNARRGKRANHGKRPCSRARRRAKRRAFGNHRRA